MKKLIFIFLLFFTFQANAGWVYDEILHVWYNSETGEVRITGDDDMDGDVGSIIVYDNSGRKTVTNSTTVLNNEDHVDIIISTIGLPQGIYYAVIVSRNGGIKTVRFVVY